MGVSGWFRGSRAPISHWTRRLKAAIADGVAIASRRRSPRRGSRAPGERKKKATTSQNGGNSARTSAATVAKLPLWLVCSASTVVPRATKA